MEQKSKVLVVEDDAGIRQSLFETLGALGFAVGEAGSGEDALQRLRMVDYDAVLLDINMPGMGGKEACRRICQAFPGLPVIMLTVRDGVDDIVEALDSGAVDYMTKPFQMGELTARLRAVIRRRQTPSALSASVRSIGDLLIDTERRQVERRGEVVHLTPKEYETLRYLVDHAGHVIRHESLLQSVWGPTHGNEREYLRVIINQLRKKIEDDPARPVYILTETHLGYRFREPK